MLKRLMLLSLAVTLACGTAPAYPGVSEVSEQISSGAVDGGQNASDEEFVRGLYKTLLNREPDEWGYNQWLKSLKSGRLNRDQVRYGFLNSTEYYVRGLYRELLNREPDPDGFNNWISRINSRQMSRAQVRRAFLASPEYRSLHGQAGAEPAQPASPGSNDGQTVVPSEYGNDTSGDLYGYSRKLFGPVWDMVMKFVEANQAYVYAAGHRDQAEIATQTDCSGFVGSVYHKLAEAAGLPAQKNYGNANSYTSSGTQKITSQYPPPNPRDLIKPGDVMVTSGGGHIVMFMGYDRSGNPLIAHSTPGTIKSSAVAGNVGCSGVRIEVMPEYMKTNVSERYPGQVPFKGVYRINGMEDMLNKLASK